MKFKDLNLKPKLLSALETMGFEDLTPIQEKTFPHILEGNDLLALAETGSGKTAACGIPLVQKIEEGVEGIQALVIVPTRELAMQYTDAIDEMAKQTQINAFAVYGGFSMEIQKAKFQDGVQILIATPGRLIDLIYSSIVSLKDIRTLILDEADEMFNMGFCEDIEFIMSCMVHEHQTLMFSATMPKEIEKLAKKSMKEPVKIELNSKRKTPQKLSHQFKFINHIHRLKELEKYLSNEQSIKQAIIFVNSRGACDKIVQALKKNIKQLEYIHGGLDQNLRSSIFSKVKSGKIKYLIATDVAGRGLDFAKVTHVINYEFPLNKEGYTHRTGRAGRMGREGVAYTLVTSRELGAVNRIVKSQKLKIEWIGGGPKVSDSNNKKKPFNKNKQKPFPAKKGKSTYKPQNKGS